MPQYATALFEDTGCVHIGVACPGPATLSGFSNHFQMLRGEMELLVQERYVSRCEATPQLIRR